MTRASVAGILVVGMIGAATLLLALWSIGFQAGTYQGEMTRSAVDQIDKAGSLIAILYAGCVVGMAVFWELHIHGRSPLQLSVLRGIGFTLLLGLGSALLALGLMYCGGGGKIFGLADMLVDAARRAVSTI
jgi:hypothetical protein